MCSLSLSRQQWIGLEQLVLTPFQVKSYKYKQNIFEPSTLDCLYIALITNWLQLLCEESFPFFMVSRAFEIREILVQNLSKNWDEFIENHEWNKKWICKALGNISFSRGKALRKTVSLPKRTVGGWNLTKNIVYCHHFVVQNWVACSKCLLQAAQFYPMVWVTIIFTIAVFLISSTVNSFPKKLKAGLLENNGINKLFKPFIRLDAFSKAAINYKKHL